MKDYSRELPAALVAAVFADDAVIAAFSWPVPLLGPLDWVGHLCTSALCLLAVAPRRALREPRLLAVALFASVVIDLDHLPLYLHLTDGVSGGRPVTHSLTTIVGLSVLALLWRRRRRVLAAVAAGVALHFVRDIATGPGLSLLAPFHSSPVRLPYVTYAVLLVVLAAEARRRWPTGLPAELVGGRSVRR